MIPQGIRDQFGDLFSAPAVRKRRNGGAVFIASDNSAVLRQGESDIVRAELAQHRALIARGYPVAAILAAGETWYVESYLGEQSVALQLAAAQPGDPAREHIFSTYLHTLRAYAAAQAHDDHQPLRFANLAATLHLWRNEHLFDASTMHVYADVLEKLRADLDGTSGLISHGDFSAWNTHSGGVIDFEDSFLAPLCYDLVCAVVTPDAFGRAEDLRGTEFPRLYAYTHDERGRILEIARSLGGPESARTIPAAAMLRIFWALRDMGHAPIIQGFRLELARSMMKEYLNGKLTIATLAIPR